jgi:hypothetical protein
MLTTGSSSSRTCVKSNSLQETQAIALPLDKRSDMFPLHDDRQHATRSRACVFDLSKDLDEPQRATPAIRPSGGARRDRTDDLMLAKHALSQLSYGPEKEGSHAKMVGLGRLELPTSRLSSARSNQLSYKPKTCPAPRRAGSSLDRRKRNEDGGCPARSA